MQVPGCDTDILKETPYSRRYKICDFHRRAPSIIISGKEQRFCQQCGRLEVRCYLCLLRVTRMWCLGGGVGSHQTYALPEPSRCRSRARPAAGDHNRTNMCIIPHLNCCRHWSCSMGRTGVAWNVAAALLYAQQPASAVVLVAPP